MDINILRGISTVLVSDRLHRDLGLGLEQATQGDFDEAANLPFADDEHRPTK